MEFFRSLDPQKQKMLKVAALITLGVLVLSFLAGFMKPSYRTVMQGGSFMGAPSTSGVAYDYAYSESSMPASYGKGGMQLSVRNVMPIMPGYGGTTGDDAEAFEVTDYSASIETTDLEETCSTITDLKVKSYVIFESSSAYDRGCNHVFKVKHENVTEVLTVIKNLDPRELTENTQTIKEQINDYTSETEILQKKLAAIDQTLKTALEAYDEITVIATRSQDAGSLAKIIDSKIGIIERLTQERININTQLDYLSRAKGDQLDRLEYTYFRINVYENKYVDGKNIADSWKNALRQFVSNTNSIVQDITIGLVAFMLMALQFILYALIILVIIKYGWRFVRGFWNK